MKFIIQKVNIGGYEMGYIEDIFYRANLQQIRGYLLNGTGPLYVNSEDYKTRLDNAYINYRDKLLILFPGMEEDSELISDFTSAITASEEVYMEIGIKVGFILANEFKNIEF